MKWLVEPRPGTEAAGRDAPKKAPVRLSTLNDQPTARAELAYAFALAGAGERKGEWSRRQAQKGAYLSVRINITIVLLSR
jgi:hypothetical protein